jgi:hypothetical protein
MQSMGLQTISVREKECVRLPTARFLQFA